MKSTRGKCQTLQMKSHFQHEASEETINKNMPRLCHDSIRYRVSSVLAKIGHEIMAKIEKQNLEQEGEGGSLQKVKADSAP